MTKNNKDSKEIKLPLVNQQHVHGEGCSHDHDDIETSVDDVLAFMQERCEDILINIRELQDAMDDLSHMVEEDVSPVSEYVTQLKDEFKRLSFLVDSMVYAPDESEGDTEN